jgi:tetratricopeptide (TPR) repeat protein
VNHSTIYDENPDLHHGLLDPQAIMYQTLGSIFFFAARRYDQAIEQYEKALEMDPHLATTHCVLGLAYQYKAMHEPAIAATRKAVELSSGATFLTAMLGVVQAAAGDRDEAEKVLAQLQEISKQKYVTPYAMARLCAALGKRDEALRWLGTAYRERAALMVILRTDPEFDSLRSDPRFQDLLRRMNFPT